ncbi:hypothetical protein CO683_34325 [Bradyrhizobium ottawaense]|uniref:hypothetical protein n=1 Tax=Bradyrhizobium ottawaense TaxID=931866 RepID=UPI000BE902D0|nr:hypothetical protein [Bradyrhizobium ottawaense]PDT65079.1 hypothetical protein CO683_34325 [Bradyrhizobium ottawaense]
MSTIQKDCADFLRMTFNNPTGGKLGSGHAHEIVAAYFGYCTAAALRAEPKYQLSALDEAAILIPDLRLMDHRMQQLNGLPVGLPNVDELASQLSGFLSKNGYLSGEVWYTRDLEEYIEVSFIQEDPMMIEDALSGEMATTNAFFDELYIDKVSLDVGDDVLVANVSGALNGENDPDKPFHGDSIAFTTMMTFERVAGRIGYRRPELETSGAVDDSYYYDEDA